MKRSLMALFVLLLSVSSVRAETAESFFDNYPALKITCGPITIVVTEGKKVNIYGVLPNTALPFYVKGSFLYLGPHRCD